MVDSILNCKKPTICRINGMRVAGGQEIGMACDLAVASDLAVLGQAGPRHGSAPDGGSTDFLPWFLSMEDAMWNCISCEMWSAYKMKLKGLVTKVVPVLKKDGEFIRNPDNPRYDHPGRADKVMAMLASVTARVIHENTVQRWEAAMSIMEQAAEHELDVALAGAKPLAQAMPKGARLSADFVNRLFPRIKTALDL